MIFQNILILCLTFMNQREICFAVCLKNPTLIFVRLQEFNYPAAAAIASVILLASLTLLFILQVVQGRLFAWQRQGR